MLNTYNNRVTNVVHKHPTTGDQVLAADEMRRLAKEAVIFSYTFDDNVVKGNVLAMRNPLNHNTDVVFRWTINGKRYQVNEEVNGGYLAMSRMEALKELCAKVARSLTEHLLADCASKTFSPIPY